MRTNHRIVPTTPSRCPCEEASESAAFATTLSRVSTRMKPFVVLPLPYTTTICCNPEGTGTTSVFALEPEEMPCSVMVRVLPSSVLYGGRASSSSGTDTKAFSSEAYHRLISPSSVDKYCIPSGGVRRSTSLDIVVIRGFLLRYLHCSTNRTGGPGCQHSGPPL